MEDAREKQPRDSDSQANDAEKQAHREREVLLLARSRVLQQLASSPNERYSESRRQALKELEEKINSLGASATAE
ncbi:MAG TPA: hypothetical protein VEN79_05960 [Terriglobia bacterium]|nr:hypothetical protein [Terriglobia bacterium]